MANSRLCQDNGEIAPMLQFARFGLVRSRGDAIL